MVLKIFILESNITKDFLMTQVEEKRSSNMRFIPDLSSLVWVSDTNNLIVYESQINEDTLRMGFEYKLNK
jgi:hypothetical protein